MYHIIVQNKRLRYEFDIKRNITIIRGDSATGKTTLYSMIALAARRGGSSVQDILEHPQDFIESHEYFSWERFFTNLLIQYTQGTYLNYSKRKLNEVYMHEKNKKAILHVMEKIVLEKKDA